MPGHGDEWGDGMIVFFYSLIFILGIIFLTAWIVFIQTHPAEFRKEMRSELLALLLLSAACFVIAAIGMSGVME